jgi:hypothetical protein
MTEFMTEEQASKIISDAFAEFMAGSDLLDSATLAEVAFYEGWAAGVRKCREILMSSKEGK